MADEPVSPASEQITGTQPPDGLTANGVPTEPAVNGTAPTNEQTTASPQPAWQRVTGWMGWGSAPARTTGRPEAQPKTSQAESKDVVREVAETIVFVVVLVLLLKTFVAEAFVIPTGSMATTLWGYQKVVTCPKCGESFPVNCSNEVNPQSGRERLFVNGCTCPNCRYDIEFARDFGPYSDGDWPGYHTGDRVLVAKYIYDTHVRPPQRDDVVVFKYPVAPQQNYEAINYIKRLVGLPHQTIAIHAGRLYGTVELDYKWREPPPGGPSSSVAREPMYTYENDDKAVALFKDSQANPELPGGFHVLRKSPDVILAMSRLVYDNDHQPRDLAGDKDLQRWTTDGNWKPDNAREPRRYDHSGEMSWLRYRHVLRDAPGKPQLITDFMGYNTGWYATEVKELSRQFPFFNRGRPMLSQNWVSDLILECDVAVESVNPGDEVVLELAKGPDRFQARFKPENGDCTLVRHRTIGQVSDKVLGTKAGTKLKGTGTFHVRLANVDDRLTLWVDGDLPFGDGVAYEPAKNDGPVKANDLQPAAVGIHGNAAVSKLLLRRDTYYTVNPSGSDVSLASDANNPGLDPWANPEAWGPLAKRPVKTIYVQPGHYLCMGDNSPESADGRTWGLVPERLLLGRALLVYFPFYPFGPVTRVGPIK